MINLKKLIMYLTVFILLFQESIQRIIPLSIIDSFDEMLVLLFTLIAIIKLMQIKKINKQVVILFFLLFCFFISGAFSLYNNSSHIFSMFIESAFLSIKCFLLIIDISIIGFDDKTKKMFISVVNNIGILCAIIGIFNFVLPNLYIKLFPFGILTYRFGFVSVTSLFYHPGRFGWFMLFLSLMNYALYKVDNSKKNKWLFLIFAIFSLMSFRTKVILSIIIILLANLIISKKIELKKIISVGVLGLAVFIIFNKVIMNTYYLYFDDNNINISARQSLTKNSFKIMEDYFPLGVGFGKYGSWYARKYYSEYYYKYNMTHVYGMSPNDAFFATDTFWGSIFGETGVLGAIFYIHFITYIYLYLKKQLKFDKTISSACIYLGLLILIQSVVESFGEQSFNSPPQYIFLALIVGTALNTAMNLGKLDGVKQ